MNRAGCRLWLGVLLVAGGLDGDDGNDGIGRGDRRRSRFRLRWWMSRDARRRRRRRCLRADASGGCRRFIKRVKGVTATTAGYSGGTTADGDLRVRFRAETTGHAESVKIVFDPSRISYGTLLRVFFTVVHDPTQLNRQGPDVGTSYRSVIFYTTPEQQKIAEAYIAQLDAAHVFPKKIVTEVVPLKAFYDGEEYHQDYAEKNPNNPYIQVCDVPKVAALQQQFPELFQDYKHK